MPLVRLSLPNALPPAPPAVVAGFIVDAQARIDSFIEAHVTEPIHAFVPSDFSLVYSALCHVADARLAPGPLFCEWGSGAGVATCLAAMLGFDARGIEFEPDLVELATRLAGQYRLLAAAPPGPRPVPWPDGRRAGKAGFCRGNFVPRGGQQIADQVDEFQWLAVGGPDPYEQLGLEINDFDIIFAYPWPGEERVVERLFDRFASDGALLMTYNGPAEGIRLFRRQRAKATE